MCGRLMERGAARSRAGRAVRRGETGTAERWRCYMRVRGGEQRRLFGIIPPPDSKSQNDYEVIVTFNNGRVDSVTSKRRRLQ